MSELIKNHAVDVKLKGHDETIVAREKQAEKGKLVRCIAEGQDGQFSVGSDYEVLAGQGDSYEGFGEVGYDMVVVEDDNGHITLGNLDPDYPHAYEFGLFGILDESDKKETKKKGK